MNSEFGALGFPGNGSESNPFRIEELEIVGSEFVGCITIGGSVTAYYEIRDCRLSNSSAAAAIQLVAGHGLIDACEIHDCTIGVSLGGGVQRIESAEIYNCSLGIHATVGFEMDLSEIHDCENCVNTLQTDDIVVHNCVFSDNGQLGFDEATGLILTGNTFNATGVWIGNSVGLTVTDNTFRVEQTLDQLSITYSQSGTVNNNVFTINALAGLRLQGSTDLIIANCQFTAPNPGGSLGIDSRGFEGMSDITIEDCTFENVGCHAGFCETGLVVTRCALSEGGILVLDSPGAEVTSNSITWGSIDVSDSCQDSLIFNNTLTHCMDHGIRVLENNTGIVVSSNYMRGAMTSLRYGISIESNDVVARYNEIENFDAGIHISEANSSDIYNNTVHGNNIGIQLAEGCSFNHLYYNILYDNAQNAKDDGSDNVWDDGIMLGNYWSNVAVPGEYRIPGTAESVDRYAQPYSTGLAIPLEVLVAITVCGVFGVLAAVVVRMKRT